MPTSPIVQGLILFGIAGVLFALWKGQRPERIAALIVIANLALGFGAKAILPNAEGVFRLANDGVAALALLLVTLRYAVPWMGAVMLFYAAQFALHSYYLVTDRSDNDYLHAVINNLNNSGIIWCLIIGTAFAWRRRSRARKLAAQPAP